MSFNWGCFTAEGNRMIVLNLTLIAKFMKAVQLMFLFFLSTPTPHEKPTPFLPLTHIYYKCLAAVEYSLKQWWKSNAVFFISMKWPVLSWGQNEFSVKMYIEVNKIEWKLSECSSNTDLKIWGSNSPWDNSTVFRDAFESFKPAYGLINMHSNYSL